jgi:hypothetical protein
MKNNSNVPVEFKVSLDSMLEKNKKDSELKRFLNINDPNYKPIIGNYCFFF